MAKNCLNHKSKEVLEVARELGVSTPVAAAMMQTVMNRKEKAGVTTTPASFIPGKINIYAGTNENSELSNFAHRPFITDLSKMPDKLSQVKVDTKFESVEQAFQFFKAVATQVVVASDITGGIMTQKDFDKLVEIKKAIKNSNGSKAKSLGRKIPMPKDAITYWDSISSDVMKALLKQSFEQNSESLKRLLDTGNSELTHTQDKGKWGKEFPKLLMEVRDELTNQEEINEEINEESELPSIEEMKEYVAETEKERKKIYDVSLGQVSQLERVFLDFDPQTRKDRSTLIASLFSTMVDELLETDPLKSRVAVINSETPTAIFNKIKESFQDKLDLGGTYEFNSEGNMDWVELTPEQEIKLQKVIDNFEALSILAANDLALLEGLKFGSNNREVKPAIFDENNPEEGNDNPSEGFAKEEDIKEGWQTNYLHESAHASLSQKVRKMLARIERIGHDGKVETDDLGYKRYLDPGYVHNTLINKLRFMQSSSDLIPLLNQLAVNKPWVNGIISQLQSDNSLLSSFYTDMRKDFVQFSIQKATQSGGRFHYKTVYINKPQGISYLIDEWRDNINSGIILSDDSVYKVDGKFNKENIKKNSTTVKSLMDDFKKGLPASASNEIKNDYVYKWIDDNLDSLNSLLKSTGIDVDNDILRLALTQTMFENNKQMSFTPTINSTLETLQTMFNEFDKVDIEYDEAGEEKRPDIYKIAQSRYNQIATTIATITEDAIESSVFENEKSYYSHLVPSYLGKTLKKLKNSMNDMSRFNKFIEEEFKKAQWFYKDGDFRLEWLRQLADQTSEGKDARDLLDHKILLNFNKVNYSDLSEMDYTLALINEFFSDEKANSAWYHVPIMSDAPVGEFIKFKRFTDRNTPKVNSIARGYKDLLLDQFVELATQEIDRMWMINERSKDNSILKVKNFDTKGTKFQFLPALNQHLETINQMLQDETTGTSLKEFLRNTISQTIEDKFNSTIREWENIGLFETIGEGKKELKHLSLPNVATKEGALPLLENYFWNSMFATSQIIQLTTTDVAYYKDVSDFQKRNKQIHAPALRGNTEAVWESTKRVNGKKVKVQEKVGREKERTIYLKDNMKSSDVYNDIEAALEAKVKSKDITIHDKEEILSAYGKGKINETDAQAYRSLPSYRRVMIMFGKWNQTMEEAYERINDGSWSMGDFNIIWQPYKPFMYTQRMVDSGVKDSQGNPIYMKMPTQHKNAEYLLLPTKAILKESSKLQAIAEFMVEGENNGEDIDVIQFESTVKDGLQGVVDINDIEDKEEIKKILNEAKKNPQQLHEVPYEDYGIQQEVPEHAIDATQLFGTQIRKLVFSDMSDDTEVEVELSPGNKQTKTKKEWHDFYKSLITSNIIDSFRDVEGIFASPKEVERILQEEVRSSSRFGNDMLQAVTLGPDGNFNIPLFEPSQSQRVQQLVNSIIKSRITKQKIKGGSLVQVSKYGSPDLRIQFKDKNGNLTYDKGEGYSIAYFECYMPWYTQKFFEPFLDPRTGELDINKKDADGNFIVPDELRKLIGYRIPTEDKYSMTPLYIKGFLPQSAGGAIMLPSEITTISGSDFDVDKMYIMLPEFEVSNDSVKRVTDKLVRMYENSHKKASSKRIGEVRNQIDILLRQMLNPEFANADYKTMRGFIDTEDITTLRFIENNWKEFRIEPTISKVQYDFSKSVLENSVAQRNNLMIDIMFGTLTNHNNVHKMLNPGGFDKQKKAARIITALKSVEYNELMRISGGKVYNYLNSLSIDQLDDLLKNYKTDLDMMNPRTQVVLHQQNTVAKVLIGIFANHNANHAVLQDTQVELSSKYTFNFIKRGGLTNLHSIKAEDGSYISKNNAGFLAASVDAVKDPVLNFMNLNSFTADAAMLLSRLGYNPNEIGLLLTQPIVQEMTTMYNKESKNGFNKRDVIQKVLDKYTDKKDESINMQFAPVITIDMLTDGLLNSKRTYNGKNIHSLTMDERVHASDMSIKTYFNDQTEIGIMFRRIMNAAQGLSDLTGVMRADTGNGGAGPTIADTINKINRVKDFIEIENSEKPYFKNANSLIQLDINVKNFTSDENKSSDEKLLEYFMSSDVPYLQAFYSLGLENTNKLLSKYFPHYKEEFVDVINQLRSMTKTNKLDVKTMNSIYNDLFAYILNSKEFFGSGNIETSLADADEMINKFPKEFNKLVENNPEIAKLDFIKGLKVATDKKTGVEVIVFRNVGGLSTAQRETISNSWTSLLYMGDTGKELALKLFKYSYYRNGFAFGPNTFIHLAPVQVKQAIPEYISSLRDILKIKQPAGYYNQFIMQYMLNHTGNKRLVPLIDINQASYGSQFLNEQKEVVDSIIINLDGKPSPEDKKAAIDIKHDEEGGTIVRWKPIIAIDYKGGTEIFVAENTSGSEDGVSMVYTRRDKLGNDNMNIQYTFGEDFDLLHGVLNTEPKAQVLDRGQSFSILGEEQGYMEDDGRSYYFDDFTANPREEAMYLSMLGSFYGEANEMEAPPISEEDLKYINTQENVRNAQKFIDDEGNTICF